MAKESVFNIIDFGAIPDGKTLNTDAIQKAIDVCTKTGGGQVYVAPGVYLTGTIFLKDNVILYLEAGAMLLGSTRIEDYKPRSVIVAEGAHTIGIAGRGTIDGQGQAFWELRDPETTPFERRKKFSWVPHHEYQHKKQVSGRLIRIIDCIDVHISNVVLKNSESWTLLILGCDDVNVRGVRILNPLIGPNTDGIDIDSSSNVTISDCYIYTADDAICLKNEVEGYTDRVCRNVTITNCILTTVCNAFKIGTGTKGSFENIVFSNSTIKAGESSEPLAKSALETIDPEHYGNALGPLGGLAIETVDGGNLRGVVVSNIVMKGVRAPIFIRRANRASLRSPNAVPGILRDVTIDNIIAYGASTTSSISGLPGYPVENVSLSNIRIEIEGGGTEKMAVRKLNELPTTYPESSMWGRFPAHGFFCRHVDDLTLNNVSVTCENPDARPLLICDDVINLRIDGLASDPSVTAEHLLCFENVRDALVKGAIPPVGTRAWVHISGHDSANILLMPDDLRNVETPIIFDDDVPTDVVCLRVS